LTFHADTDEKQSKVAIMAEQHFARLCEVCKGINFAAIMTPREWDDHNGEWKAVFRPEYDGNGKDPEMTWGRFSKVHRPGSPEDDLPGIRHAFYDDLSVSTQSDEEGYGPPPSVQSWESVSESGSEEDMYDDLSSDSGEDGLDQLWSDEIPAREKPAQPSIPTSSVYLNEFREENVSEDIDHSHGIQDESAYQDSEQDDDYGDLSSMSTWSGDSHFTEYGRIDRVKQARGNWAYRHGHFYYLGTIWDLRSRRQSCRLCWRLWRHVRKNPQVKDEFITKSRCVLKAAELVGDRSSGEKVSMLNLVFLYVYKTDNPRAQKWQTAMGFAMQGTHRDILAESVERPAHAFDDRLWGEARWQDDQCDFELFRKWLRTCEASHEHSTGNTNSCLNLRFIDVERRCIIDWSGPASEMPRFVVLSYVWGIAKQKLMLTSDRLAEFRRPGFFHNCPMDKTIRDALHVTAALGERYLWVDALCILQDSHADKNAQIPQMQHVYGLAVLTIIAAFGNSADGGLPGVAPKSRTGTRFKLELKDIRVTFRGNTSVDAEERYMGFRENYLQRSPWRRRAWTFQEGRLSARALVFTKDQVYFECDKCTWCEQTHWESNDIDFMSWRAIKDPVPEATWEDWLWRRGYDASPPPHPRESQVSQNTTYAATVREYSTRLLSYDEDVLNACSGVLNSMRLSEDTDFFFGLRRRCFGNDLLFNTASSLYPRFRNDGNNIFPTWSWASWKGTIDIANEPRNSSFDPIDNLVSCDGVKCYEMVVDAQGNKEIKVINENGGWRFAADYEREGGGIFDPSMLFAPRPGGFIDQNVSVHPDTSSDELNEVIDPFEDRKHCHAEAQGGVNRGRSANRPESDEGATTAEQTSAKVAVPDKIDTTLRVKASAGTKVPQYGQDIHRKELDALSAFGQIRPNFHIIFKTFAATVVLRTKLTGAWPNRELFACRTKAKGGRTPIPPRPPILTPETRHDAAVQALEILKGPPFVLPDHLEEMAFVGTLPLPHTAEAAIMGLHDVPDGLYVLLWMNNNQLPNMGHLLCKPATDSVANDVDWDGSILRRVTACIGPTKILQEATQKKFGAEWRTIVLG
jgi:hypothetical protein